MDVKTSTIARSIWLGIALINQILAVFGKDRLPFAEDDVYQCVSLIVTIVASGIAWWKNNSFTRAAIEADEYMSELKEKDNGQDN